MLLDEDGEQEEILGIRPVLRSSIALGCGRNLHAHRGPGLFAGLHGTHVAVEYENSRNPLLQASERREMV